MHETNLLPIPGSDTRIKITYGLSWHKGNKKPYFSITGTTYVPHHIYKNQFVTDCSGCIHDEILKLGPKFQDLVDLHLSDDDGVPMHAAANGFYWLAGGNDIHKRDYIHKDGYSEKGEQLYGPFSTDRRVKPNHDHVKSCLRINDETLQTLIDMLGPYYSPSIGFLCDHEEKLVRKRFEDWVETQKPRWKAEADAAIKRHKIIRPTKPE